MNSLPKVHIQGDICTKTTARIIAPRILKQILEEKQKESK